MVGVLQPFVVYVFCLFRAVHGCNTEYNASLCLCKLITGPYLPQSALIGYNNTHRDKPGRNKCCSKKFTCMHMVHSFSLRRDSKGLYVALVVYRKLNECTNIPC